MREVSVNVKTKAKTKAATPFKENIPFPITLIYFLQYGLEFTVNSSSSEVKHHLRIPGIYKMHGYLGISCLI